MCISIYVYTRIYIYIYACINAYVCVYIYNHMPKHSMCLLTDSACPNLGLHIKWNALKETIGNQQSYFPPLVFFIAAPGAFLW